MPPEQRSSTPASPVSVEALANRVALIWSNRLEDANEAVLLGPYELDRVLGRGSQGIVFAGFDRQLEREVALKLFRLPAPEQVILHEARSLARLKHPNVVPLHELRRDRGFTYLVMDLVDGWTMGQRMSMLDDWRELTLLFLRAGRGLAATHEAGLAHGDVKPSNILVGHDERVQIADFGFAQPLRAESGDESVKRGGTPGYAAPELALGVRADARSDQFSFCATMWEGLFGARPWGSSLDPMLSGVEPNKPRPRPGIPAKLEELLRRGLAPEPRRRHESMNVLLCEIVHVLIAARRGWNRWSRRTSTSAS